jgi:hypothetical protein
MERGIYFDGWFKNNHCYHPSLPLRSAQMIEDLEKYRGTLLVWSAMGGGSISLPYLEHEAFGPVDPRMRFYGYMNDSEFIAECGKLGIKVFGIVFEVQGWEFPAVVDAQTGELKRLNLVRDGEAHGWYGLREFSQDAYPGLFRTSLKDYYPQGIVNSDGEPVSDLWEECAARKLDGAPVHAQWVEVKNHPHICYQTCRNNPVWRDYLKRIIKLQIDAGVHGVQLDEAELPITSIGSGGCFCKDCMKQFTQYLRARRAEGLLGPQFDAIDLDKFNYKDYLIQTGSSYPHGAPFYREYWEFQMRAVKRYFGELADYAKSYGRDAHGRDVQVSGNFFNLMPVYYPIEDKVDVLITEMQHTLFRQPHFYRYCAGFAGKKPIIVAENPYGGIVPALLSQLDAGKGYDLYRIFLLEASVYGCNMAVPYGGWMGNAIKDAFYPPREVTGEVQDFLYANERAFPKTDGLGAAVLYSFPSYYWRETTKGSQGNTMLIDEQRSLLDSTMSEWDEPGAARMPFWDAIKALSARQAMYDVKMMADGDVREDGFGLDAIQGYPLVIVPDCHVLTQNQADVLLRYARDGGRVLVYGRIAEGTDLAARLAEVESVRFVALEEQGRPMADFLDAFDEMYSGVNTLTCSDGDLGIQRFDDAGRTYVHVLNYRYNKERDAVATAPEVRFSIGRTVGGVSVRTLDGHVPEHAVVRRGDSLDVTIRDLPLYTLLEIGE